MRVVRNKRRVSGKVRIRKEIPSITLGVWIVALVVLTLLVPNFSYAVIFTVNSTSDAPDANPGDGACETAGGECTLRSAIEESNVLSGPDIINLPAGPYLLTLGQIPISDSLILNGDGAESTIIDGNASSRIFFIETSSQDLLVCDSINDSVLLFNGDGGFVSNFIPSGSGGLDISAAATLGPGLLVAGFTSGIHLYEPIGGDFIQLFVPPGTGGLLGPTDLTFGPGFPVDSNLYVTVFQPGGGILRFNRTTGEFIDEFIPAGSGGLAFPNSIVFGPDNNLYVTSAGTNEVLRYNGTTGAFIDSFVSPLGGLSTPRDLDFGPDGNLYVASEDNDRIIRYDGTTGAFIDIFVSTGSGGLDEPTDLAFGPDGNLYVISAGTQEVLRYNGTTGDFIDSFISAGDGGLGSPSCIVFIPGLSSEAIVNISGVTIRNGLDPGAGGSGGAIRIFGPTSVSLTESVVSGNRANTFGAGIRNSGFLQIARSTIKDNEITGDPGGGGVTATGGGIMNFAGGSVRIVESTINDNQSTRGGGINNNGGFLSITNSTVSGNRAFTQGGGIRNQLGIVDISFSTITENQAGFPLPPGTIGSGEDRVGGGIFNTLGTVFTGNTILAENTNNLSSFSDDFSPDCFSETPASFISFSNNILGVNANCNFTATIGDQAGTSDSPIDPLLDSLQDNGGPTLTHALLDGSPAIDAGNNAVCLSTDQRGFIRPVDGNDNGISTCDIGAFEFGSTPPPTITCGGEVATIVGTPGDDVINGTSGIDIINGLGGNDLIRGFSGNDRLCGDAGHDTLIGGDGNDRLFGMIGKDKLSGGNGDDRLFGGAGDDTVNGGNGNDRLFGRGGNDKLRGMMGNDNIFGQNGDDNLFGGADNDSLNGGSGSDFLDGVSGTDTCDGGNGTDSSFRCESTTNIP